MKILLYDIEVTSPIGDAWRGYDTDIHHWRRDWWVLCFAYKWLGDKKVRVVGQDDFKGYQKNREDDSHVIKELHKLFSEADVVIGHNSDSFDNKKVQARMVSLGLPPPAPYKQLDTKKIAKKYFSFTSNKLDDLGRYLGIGQKLDTGGYGLWLGCEEGDPKAWKKMKRYNKQDVVLLEEVYLKLRPWIANHPAVDNRDNCPKCNSANMQKRGYGFNKTSKYQRFQCMDCGGWSRVRVNEQMDVHFIN